MARNLWQPLESLPVTGVDPRIFCRNHFKLTVLDDERAIAAEEAEPGYLKGCVQLLAKVLSVTARTVRGWGRLTYSKMPAHYLMVLAYAQNLKTLPKQPMTPREFCQRFFGIHNLHPSHIAEHETETGYRGKCNQLLARVLGVTTRTVRSWGNLNYSKMPKRYRLVLAYALAAMGFHSEQQRPSAMPLAA
ncbi:hypothetical protein WA1_49540 [Scytonema hofmannii PCC 7110]|uniref:Uncharacterized protein n=1 Tax=Scytonema hofmannii PCC 7110 TaxID=128403 RepID=A0A139WQT2_9CYAN|nr:hypothetical protein [Scytonema hofmannii]KYC34782.1 hypothetical protein WA1_49540 [Scytonema hofmannii PCC 7110]